MAMGALKETSDSCSIVKQSQNSFKKYQQSKVLVTSARWRKRPWAAHHCGRVGRLPQPTAHCLCGSRGRRWGQERDGPGQAGTIP